MKKLNTKEITVVGILLALMIVLAATPLGFIPIGPINATTIHIPVIIAAVLYGRKISLIMGLFWTNIFCKSLFKSFNCKFYPNGSTCIYYSKDSYGIFNWSFIWSN